MLSISANSLYKNTFFLFISSIVNSLFGFVFWVYVARNYFSSEVGLISTVISFSGLVVELGQAGLGLGTIRFMSENKEKHSFIVTIFSTVFLNTTIFATLTILVIMYLSKLTVLFNGIFILLYLIFINFESLSLMIDFYLISNKNTQYIFLKNILHGIIKISLLFLITKNYIVCKDNYIKIFLAIVLPSVIVVSTFCFIYLYNNYKGLIYNFNIIKKIFPYSITNQVSSFLWNAPQMIFPLIILNVLGPKQSAKYYISWMIAAILTAVSIFLGNSFVAETSGNISNIKNNIKRALKIEFFIILIICIFYFYDDVLLRKLFGIEYSDSGRMLFYLSLLAVPSLVNQLYISVLRIKELNLHIIKISILYAVISISLGYILLIMFNNVNYLIFGWIIAQLILSIVSIKGIHGITYR